MRDWDRRAVLAGAAGLAIARPAWAAPKLAVGDMTIGRPNAKLKLVEYASASCPHCARFHNETFPAFKKAYIDTGKVQLTLREMLTQPANVAAAGFLIARCRGPSRYFPTLATVFKNQREMFKPGGVLRVGQMAGLPKKMVEACVSDEAGLAAANDSTDRAVAEGVEMTPTFILNGTKVHEGFWPFAEMAAALDAAL
jgi:protein-disulfide isomerase